MHGPTRLLQLSLQPYIQHGCIDRGGGPVDLYAGYPLIEQLAPGNEDNQGIPLMLCSAMIARDIVDMEQEQGVEQLICKWCIK